MPNKKKPETPSVVHPNAWNKSHGTYIAGAAHIDGVDTIAAEMERRWGCGRLRLLVSPELRERFDKQRYKFNSAIQNGELEDVIRESARMVNAWKALQSAAEGSGSVPLDPKVWEVTLEDGTVVALAQTSAEAHAVPTQGRKLVVYTLEEVGMILAHYRDAVAMKLAYPGSEVTRVKKSVPDPLDGIRYASDLDDPMDDLFHEGAYQ